MSTIGADDLIFYTDKEGEIYSGGFRVNSILMKQGFSPIMTFNSEFQKGGENKITDDKVSDLFDNLVVPNWSLAFQFKQGGNIRKDLQHEYEEENQDDDILSEDIHDKLLNMVSLHKSELKKSSNKKTRRTIIKRSNKITKKKIEK